MDNRYNCNRNL